MDLYRQLGLVRPADGAASKAARIAARDAQDDGAGPDEFMDAAGADDYD